MANDGNARGCGEGGGRIDISSECQPDPADFSYGSLTKNIMKWGFTGSRLSGWHIEWPTM